MTEGAGFSGRYANKPLPDVSGVRFGLKLLLVSSGIIVLVESLPAASHLSILSPRVCFRFACFVSSVLRLILFSLLPVETSFLRERSRGQGVNYKINESRDRLEIVRGDKKRRKKNRREEGNVEWLNGDRGAPGWKRLENGTRLEDDFFFFNIFNRPSVITCLEWFVNEYTGMKIQSKYSINI